MTMSNSSDNAAVTVVVRRMTKPGCETDFEEAMREFAAFALAAPGNRGIHILRSGEGHPREYTVVDRFVDEDARSAFVALPAYQEWMVRLRALTEEEPDIQQGGGLCGWFTLPGHTTAAPPKRVKMALVTFLGVYPLTSVLPRFVGGLLPGWHPLVVNIFATGLVVILLTWAVMPVLTRVFRRWLFPSNPKIP